MGFGPEDTNFALELTQNYGVDHYDLGTGFGHFALALPDVYKACESIKKAGERQYNMGPTTSTSQLDRRLCGLCRYFLCLDAATVALVPQ